jgi:hypothetical protein
MHPVPRDNYDESLSTARDKDHDLNPDVRITQPMNDNMTVHEQELADDLTNGEMQNRVFDNAMDTDPVVENNKMPENGVDEKMIVES